MRLAAGEIVDRYELIAPIGRGGQASVWRARRLEGGGVVALKLMRLRGGASDERARREARALSRIEHPSLPRCGAFFESDALGVMGLELELIEGTDLFSMRSDPSLNRRARTLALKHVASALAHLHSLGVVHRDVKLSNVVATHDFLRAPENAHRCKLLDLGIAVLVGNPEPLTQLGHPGTVPYLAPEALDPVRFCELAARPTLDIFAFGVAGWLLLNGEHPAGVTLDVAEEDLVDLYAARADAQLDVVPLSDRVDPITRVLSRCLHLRPAGRPQNGSELVAELERALVVSTRVDEPSIVIRTEPPPPVPPTLRNPRAIHPAAWFVLGAATVAGGFGVYRLLDSPDQTGDVASARVSADDSEPTEHAKPTPVEVDDEEKRDDRNGSVPSEQAWAAQKEEAFVRHSSALACETKVVGDWFRIRCKPPLGVLLAVRWPEGKPEGAIVEEGLFELTVIVPLKGSGIAIELDWRGGWGKRSLGIIGLRMPNGWLQGEFDRGVQGG